MKVITFSRCFPATHPRKGESTWFVEKILIAHGINNINMVDEKIYDYVNDFALAMEDAKHHTIRAGNRLKAGDTFSARVWSGKPYASKQIEFAQIEVKKTWQFEIKSDGDYCLDTCNYGSFCNKSTELKEIAKNDGLDIDDFISWFDIHPKKNGESFKGQIICWNENINY